MRKQGKQLGQEKINPAVWRKTGQPETNKVGKHVIQNKTNESTIIKLGGNRESEDAQKKSRGNRNFSDQGDAGLGFQGVGHGKIDVSKTKQRDEMDNNGHLPLLRDKSTVGKMAARLEKEKRKKASSFKYGNQSFANRIDEVDEELSFDESKTRSQLGESLESIATLKTPSASKTGALEILETPTLGTARSQKNHDTKNYGKNSRLSKMDPQNSSFKQDAVLAAQDNEFPALNSPLVSFEFFDTKNTNNKKASNRLKDSLSQIKSPQRLESAENKLNTITAFGNEAVRRQSNKEPITYIANGMKDMKYRKSSASSRWSPRLSVPQDILQCEVYSMQQLRFTSNYTFSFFDLPSIYDEQNKMIHSNVNMIGKRKTRPKFSKPPSKDFRRPERPAPPKTSKLTEL